MYKDSKEKREEENEQLKKEKLKTYEDIQYLTKILIEKDICQQYTDYRSFSKQYCFHQCFNRYNCKGNEKIKIMEENLIIINKKIENNKEYIDRDKFLN